MAEDYLDTWEEEGVKVKHKYNTVIHFLLGTCKAFNRGCRRLYSILSSSGTKGNAGGAWKKYKEISAKLGMDAGADRIMNPSKIVENNHWNYDSHQPEPGMFDDDLMLGKRNRGNNEHDNHSHQLGMWDDDLILGRNRR